MWHANECLEAPLRWGVPTYEALSRPFNELLSVRVNRELHLVKNMCHVWKRGAVSTTVLHSKCTPTSHRLSLTGIDWLCLLIYLPPIDHARCCPYAVLARRRGRCRSAASDGREITCCGRFEQRQQPARTKPQRYLEHQHYWKFQLYHRLELCLWRSCRGG